MGWGKSKLRGMRRALVLQKFSKFSWVTRQPRAREAGRTKRTGLSPASFPGITQRSYWWRGVAPNDLLPNARRFRVVNAGNTRKIEIDTSQGT